MILDLLKIFPFNMSMNPLFGNPFWPTIRFIDSSRSSNVAFLNPLDGAFQQATIAGGF